MDGRGAHRIMTAMARWCAWLVRRPAFQSVTLGVIATNAVVLGLETSPAVRQAIGTVLSWFHLGVNTMFVLELFARFVAYWPHTRSFLRDGWNVFDVTVVALSLVPAVGAIGGVARVVRVLRVLRVVRMVAELRLIVGTMLRSIRSLAYVSLLVGLLLYIYAVVGVTAFASIDPARWGSLPAALLTLFQVLTLEGWIDTQARVSGQPLAPVFFVTFIITAVFVMVNLFIAVVVNNLDTVRRTDGRRPRSGAIVRLRKRWIGIGARAFCRQRKAVTLPRCLSSRARWCGRAWNAG